MQKLATLTVDPAGASPSTLRGPAPSEADNEPNHVTSTTINRQKVAYLSIKLNQEQAYKFSLMPRKYVFI